MYGKPSYWLGKTLSKETRKKISNANRGMIRSMATRKKMSESGRGRIFSAEHKGKISKALLGKVKSKETCKRISDSHKGKVISPEHRKKLSESGKGKIISIETRKKISRANKGKIRSVKARENISRSKIGTIQTKEHRLKNSIANSGKNNAMYGKTHSEEVRIKQSCKMQDIDYNDWNGFVSYKEYCCEWSVPEFKEYIKERDNYKCQNPDCWGTSDKLNIIFFELSPLWTMKVVLSTSDLFERVCVSDVPTMVPDRPWTPLDAPRWDELAET